ncbi:unnamed protein product [Cuscuta epithymum]|uniref:Uncharacterized protein n=1 Tax=Cuscuta epithymum TaxID=186058 RepID=A0AAV0DD40_9ASTE|nr:unnamed protein product [Cuscuta epithymum]
MMAAVIRGGSGPRPGRA